MLTFIGTFIDRVGSRGFGVTRRGGTGDNLAIDRGRSWVEVVLSGAEEIEHNTD